MADIHNEMKYNTGITGATRIIAGVDGSVHPGVERVSETLQPGFDVFAQPEHAVLRGEQLGSIRAFSGSLAAEFSICCFVNPLTSRNLVILDAATAQFGAALVVRSEVVTYATVAATLAPNPAAPVVLARDRRFKVPTATGRLSLAVGTDPANTFGVQLEEIIGAANTSIPFITSFPLILDPGDCWLAIAQTVNQAIIVCLKWHERPALPGEIG